MFIQLKNTSIELQIITLKSTVVGNTVKSLANLAGHSLRIARAQT